MTVEHLDDPDVEVTGSVLRSTPLARIRDRARNSVRTAAAVREAAPDYFDPDDMEWARQAGEAAAKRPLRRGRGGYGDDYYRHVALSAIELATDRRDVVKALCEQAPHFAEETIKKRIRRARELGFLAPTTKGRANFAPGPNLYKKGDGDG